VCEFKFLGVLGVRYVDGNGDAVSAFGWWTLLSGNVGGGRGFGATKLAAVVAMVGSGSDDGTGCFYALITVRTGRK
jgi:hypothetical protein